MVDDFSYLCVLQTFLLNVLQGPLTEEFVFRACMLPVLVPSLGESWSLLLCPLFFGVGMFSATVDIQLSNR